MKNSSGYRVCALFMLLLTGALLSPDALAQAKDPEASANPESGFPRAGTVTAKTLNVRARPGMFYEVIAKLEAEDKVDVLERQDEWYRISVPEDADAWVADRFVSEDERITGEGVRVRAGTGVAFSAYHTLDEGTSVQPTGEARDDWVRIVPPLGATAWVSAQFVELAPPKTDPAAKTEPDSGQKTRQDEESEMKSATDVPADTETTTKQTENREAADSAIDEDADARDEPVDVKEDPAEDEKTQGAQSETKAEREPERENQERADVDLRDRVRSERSSSDESRGVKMLPPIRLPEKESGTDADEEDEEVRITRPLVTRRRAKTSEREADAPLVYTKVPSDEEYNDADVEADSKADEKPAEAGMEQPEQEKDVAKPEGRGCGQTKAEKPEAPNAFRITGVVVSLGDRANEATSHVVVRSNSGRMEPVAYLRSQNIDLAEWEGRKLHVYGRRIPCDWSKPLVAVSGVLIAR